MNHEIEPVLGILDDGHAFPDGLPSLYGYVQGIIEAEELSYEEWVHPLRMTGGQLALKWEAKSFDSWGYVWWEPTGLVYTFETGGNRYDGPGAVNCFKETLYGIRARTEDITVVLKEDIDA